MTKGLCGGRDFKKKKKDYHDSVERNKCQVIFSQLKNEKLLNTVSHFLLGDKQQRTTN